ncbi:MAG: DUF503 domain-containing protein [Candidatus Omnitrophica bacterium]|nr:DUF503 domain-containing protein [Candidatus Omnitrophota bacterium]
MTVGILRLDIFIPQANSLKFKRMVLHSLKARLRNNFNVAVAQIDSQDKWQKSRLAIVGVEKSRNNLNSTLSNVVNFIETIDSIHLIDYEMEMI